MATKHTVFIDSQLSDSESFVARYSTDLFNVVFFQDSAQIQAYLTENTISAANINVISASDTVSGIFTPRVVFIDPRVPDYQTLIADLDTNTTAVLLDGNQDGVQQIHDFLEKNTDPNLKLGAIDIITNIDSLDVVSHGTSGEIVLGNTVLNSDTLAVTYADLLADIGSHLTDNGDILLYGCNVAADSAGQRFIQDLAAATGADVAASTDLTGSATLGGDWVLEASVGQLEAQPLSFADYGSTLGVGVLNNAYVKFGYKTDGTLGWGGNTQPGIQYDSSGTRNFLSTADYLTPGTPWEMFGVTVNGATAFNNNSGGVGLSTTLSGQSLTTSGADTYGSLTYTSTYNGLKVTQVYTLGASSQVITMQVTMENTGSTTLSGVKYVRGIDPDVDSNGLSGSTPSTNNVRGVIDNPSTPVNDAISATDIVLATGPVSGRVIGLYTNSSFTHNTGVSSGWSSNPQDYISGIYNGNGDYTIGVGFDLGNFVPGQIKSFSFAYVFAASGAALQASVDSVPTPPTLTSFAAPVASTNEDVSVAITYAQLAAQGNEADDKAVTAFVIKNVTSGTLKIGSSEATATNWAAGTNDTLPSDGSLKLFWTPANNANGTLNAFTVVARDGDGLVSATPVQVQVTASSVNDAPVLTTSSALPYTENATAVAINNVLTLSDIDSPNLTGATVSITTNFANGQDVLGFTNQNGISGSYNASTGVLTLTGTSTVANYQAALRSVTYRNSSENPSTAVRTISFAVDDGQATNHASNVLTSTVNVTAVNDAPIANATSATGNNNSAIAINLAGSDVDSSIARFKIISLPAHGTLSFGGTAVHIGDSITATANAASLSFVPDTNWNGNTGFSYAAIDSVGALQSAANANVSITVLDTIAPTVTITSTGGLTNVATQTITGTSEAGSIVTLSNGVTPTVDPNTGNWSANVELTEGINAITVTDTDASNNASTVVATYTLDTQLTAPTVALQVNSGNSGDSKNNITNDARLVFNEKDTDATRVITVDDVDIAGSYDASALLDGSHTVRVTDTDLAGNVKTSSLTFKLDTSTAAPTVALTNDTGSSHTDGITSNGALTVTGVEDQAILSYSVDGGAFAPTVSAHEGVNVVIVKATDTAGNSNSTSITYTLDTTNPDALGIALHSDTTNQGSPGFSSDGITNDNLVNVTNLEAGATWQYSVDGADWIEGGDIHGFTLEPGSYSSVRVKQTDAAGNESAITDLGAVTIDTTAPATPIIGAKPAITNNGAISVSGVVEDGALWQYSLDNGANWADGSGPSVTLSGDGDKNVLVRQLDKAGNISGSDSVNFTLDTTAPAMLNASLVADTSNGASSSFASDGITSNGSLAIEGLEAGAAWKYSLDGGNSWSENQSSSSLTLEPGSYVAAQVQIQQTDAAGNAGEIGKLGAIQVVIDAPEPTLTKSINQVSLGNLQDGAQWEYTIDGGSHWIGRTTWHTGDTATFTIPDGIYTDDSIQARQIDIAGNVSAAVGVDGGLVDTTAPELPVIALVNDTTNGSNPDFATDGVSSDGTVKISNIKEDVTLQYSINGGGDWTTVALKAGDTHTFTLEAGIYNAGKVLAKLSDASGNTSQPVELRPVTVITHSNTPSIAFVDTGISNSDGVTNNGLVQINDLSSGSIWEYSLDGATWKQGSGESLSLTGDGNKSVRIHQIDKAGNLSDNDSLSFTLDTKAPNVTTAITKLSSDTGSSKKDFVTNVAEQTLKGTYTGLLGAGEVIQVSADGSTWITTNIRSTEDDDHDGSDYDHEEDDSDNHDHEEGDSISHDWIASGITLSEGTGTLFVRAVDLAGNVTPGATHSYTLDTQAPAVSITSLGGITNKSTQTITGTGTVGDTIIIKDGNDHEDHDNQQLSKVVVDATGHWTSTIVLKDGVHTLTAQDTDLAGNTGMSNVLNFTVDTKAPKATASITNVSDVLSISGSVKGDLGEHEVVNLYEGNTLIGTATPDNNGKWTVSGVPTGLHSYTTKIADQAGNEGSASAVTKIALGTAGNDSFTGSASGTNIFVGRGGADVLTGNNTAKDVFVYKSVSDSTVAAADIINNFVHNSDDIDLSAIAGINSAKALSVGKNGVAPTTIGAHSIGWLSSGGNTLVYVNPTDNKSQSLSDPATMKIILTGTIGLTSSDFILANSDN